MVSITSCNYRVHKTGSKQSVAFKAPITYEYRFDYDKGDSLFDKQSIAEYNELFNSIKSCSTDSFSSLYLEIYLYPYFWKEEIANE